MNLPVLPTISTSFIVLSAILVAIGWYFIRTKNQIAHQRTMVAAAIAAVLFFLIYVSRTVLVGNTKFGSEDPTLLLAYYIFLFSHIVLAIVAAILGLVTLYRAWKKQFEKHRKLGPTTAVVWFTTAITGVTVYLLLYVFFPGGKTVGLLEKLFGW